MHPGPVCVHGPSLFEDSSQTFASSSAWISLLSFAYLPDDQQLQGLCWQISLCFCQQTSLLTWLILPACHLPFLEAALAALLAAPCGLLLPSCQLVPGRQTIARLSASLVSKDHEQGARDSKYLEDGQWTCTLGSTNACQCRALRICRSLGVKAPQRCRC